MKLAIIAGGKGTRLGLEGIPKPMALVAGKPVMEHLINLAGCCGIKDIYILSGYLADVIRDYFGDGSRFGVNITHITEQAPMGTAGAVRLLQGKIRERFMVFYGDVLMDMDLRAFMESDKKSGSLATIVVHPNDHPHDSDLVDIDDENRVVAFFSKPHAENAYYRNLVNAAVYILSPRIFEYIPDDRPSDFGKDIFRRVLEAKETLKAYKTAEYLKDIGTADRLRKAGEDFLGGRLQRLSRRNKRPAVFMDRDGTLIKYVDLLCRAEDLETYGFSAAAVKKINNSDFLGILITNQPVVARNMCDLRTVRHMHNKLETLLGREGAYLNDIYFCPHHPDRGYPGENTDYKIACDCRKPATGMIKKAVKEYNIDMDRSWFIGDTTTDILTGQSAGLRTILVMTGRGGQDGRFLCTPDYSFDDIEKAVDFILSGKDKEG